MTMIALYDRHNFQEILWPDTRSKEQAYLLAFLCEGAAAYMQNVETDCYILRVDDVFFPVTVNHTEYDASYVCSPYTACILYACEEIRKIPNPLLRLLLKPLIQSMGFFFRAAKINKVVCVNNWLLSTNLYPKWEGEAIPALTHFLQEMFPQHVVMFRSLNPHTNQALLKRFREANYHSLPSRQVYLFDRNLSDFHQRHNTKLDQKQLSTSAYQLVGHDEIGESDYHRITVLYRLLYLEKYSYYNPQFTERYIRLCHQKRLMVLQGLRNKQGVLDGIIGFFEQDGVITAPLVGYDTAKSQKHALYRMLMALAIKRGQENAEILNLSSGASHFKRLRGGVGVIEYSAVYYSHLPLYRRWVWQWLRMVLTVLGIPIMKKYQL